MGAVRFSAKSIGVVSVVLAGLVLWGVWTAYDSARTESAEEVPERGGERAAPVRTRVVEPEAFGRTLTFNGTFRARESVAIRSEVSGRVEEIFFEDGERVAAGDRLLRIDDRELRARVGGLRAELELARLNEERLETLLGRDAVARREVDEAVSRRKVLEADLEELTARLDKTVIRAPFAGVLGFRRVSVGAYLQSDSEITSLRAPSPILLDFSVAERFRGEMGRGMTVEAEVAGYGRSFSGRVTRVAPDVDPETRTLTVRASFENERDLLRPGAFGRVRVELVREDVLVVPSTAVLRGLLDVAVFVVVDGKAERRVVETGERTGKRVPVLDGLEPGDEVIVEGTQRVRRGGAVEVLNGENGG